MFLIAFLIVCFVVYLATGTNPAWSCGHSADALTDCRVCGRSYCAQCEPVCEGHS